MINSNFLGNEIDSELNEAVKKNEGLIFVQFKTKEATEIFKHDFEHLK